MNHHCPVFLSSHGQRMDRQKVINADPKGQVSLTIFLNITIILVILKKIIIGSLLG